MAVAMVFGAGSAISIKNQSSKKYFKRKSIYDLHTDTHLRSTEEARRLITRYEF
jgi:hypothetical protein